MKRLLNRRLTRIYRTTTRRDPWATIQVTIPATAFPDAPTWTPGPGWIEGRDECTWLWDHQDGTWTVIHGPVDLDDGREVVMTARTRHWEEAFDKPRRYLDAHYRVGEPTFQDFADHPLSAVEDYWWGFYGRHFVLPSRAFGSNPDPDAGPRDYYIRPPAGHLGTVFEVASGEPGFREIRAAVALCRRRGGTWRVFRGGKEPWRVGFSD